MHYAQVGLVAGGVLFFSGCVFQHLRIERQLKEAHSWPSVPGEVISRSIERNDAVDANGLCASWYVPRISYAYIVDGRRYEGHRIGFKVITRNMEQEALGEMRLYPVGSRPLIRYNPFRPDECVLQLQTSTNVNLRAAAICASLMILGALLPHVVA